jgi:hypothetical protein
VLPKDRGRMPTSAIYAELQELTDQILTLFSPSFLVGLLL